MLYSVEKGNDWLADLDNKAQAAISVGKSEGFIHAGDPVVIINGWKQGLNFTNTMRIVYVPTIPQTLLF